MQIRVYDKQLNLIGFSENPTSFLWNRAYNETGSFEGHFPITEHNVKLFSIGNLIAIKECVDCGVIEFVQAHENANDHELIVSGRFATSYLDRRIINGILNFNGTVENCIRKIINDYVNIPNFELGTIKGYTESVELQASYKDVLDMTKILAQSVNYGIRVKPDFTNKKLVFELYKGIDHSISQVNNSHVEFSKRYGNIEQADYVCNSQLEKNVAIVLGEGEGSARQKVVVGETSLVGLDRKEMYVDARDLQKVDGMTTAQYIQVLTERGLEKLREQVFANSFEAEVNADGNFTYKRDYDVGDIVTIKKSKWGAQEDLRITELTEVYEHGEMRVGLTFGTPLPMNIDMEG